MTQNIMPPDPVPSGHVPTGRPDLDLRGGNTRWPLRTKLSRGAWNLCWLLLFRPTPKRMGNRWRLWLLRRFGAAIHGEALIHPSCRILIPANLELHDGVAIGEAVEIYNYGVVKIGRMTVISQYTYLCTGSHDYTDRQMPLVWAPITVGDNAWVAAGVFIAPGVSVGSGAVVGARSVVTKDLPDWTVCAGNPCRPLKPRVMREAT